MSLLPWPASIIAVIRDSARIFIKNTIDIEET